MKGYSTIFLKAAIAIIGLIVLGLCVFLLPLFINYFGYTILIGVYATAIFFFLALYHTLKLLRYIDKSKAFSELSVKALRNIKYCGIIIGVLYAVLIPFLFPIADSDDAPGIIAFPIIIIFAASIISVFAATLQKLLKEAIDMKSENDLTVWGE